MKQLFEQLEAAEQEAEEISKREEQLDFLDMKKEQLLDEIRIGLENVEDGHISNINDLLDVIDGIRADLDRLEDLVAEAEGVIHE